MNTKKLCFIILVLTIMLSGAAIAWGHYTSSQEANGFSLNITAAQSCEINVSVWNITIPKEGEMTFDLYIDGLLVTNDVSSYSGAFSAGSYYQITDMQGDLEYFREHKYRSLEGTLTAEGVTRLLLANKPGTCLVDLNTQNLVSADIYMDGKQIANDVFDYYYFFNHGTVLTFTDIRANEGYIYTGEQSITVAIEDGDTFRKVNLYEHLVVEEAS